MPVSQLISVWFMYGIAAFLLEIGYLYFIHSLFKQPVVKAALFLPVVLIMGAGVYYSLQYWFVVGLFK